jgi:superfamily II DNA or RNA helicase
MIAPARFGLTATLPQGLDYKLSLEGLIGPVIGQLSLSDGVSLGILAKPRIKVLKIPYSHKIRELRTYQDVYEQGIVQNKERNEIIVSTTLNFIKEKNTVLIFVSKIEHGKIISTLLKNKQIDAPFVYGNTEEEERKALKNALQRKERPCIIASTVWQTGINIPSLNVLINASGGKSDVTTLQKIGRALRTTDEKKTVWIVDCFDQSHPHLISHFAHRFCLYCDEGWV